MIEKTITRPLAKALIESSVIGLMVCKANAAETPIGAIYKIRSGRKKDLYSAVVYDLSGENKFRNPHDAQKCIAHRYFNAVLRGEINEICD